MRQSKNSFRHESLQDAQTIQDLLDHWRHAVKKQGDGFLTR